VIVLASCFDRVHPLATDLAMRHTVCDRLSAR
jgi:hypothetical protein